jgi:integrase
MSVEPTAAASRPPSRRGEAIRRQAGFSLHSLRHAFAYLLIAKGLNVVCVPRQIGHSSPTITLDVYAHLFEQADHATAAREALEPSYAAMVTASER